MTWTAERGALYLRKYALSVKKPFLIEDAVRESKEQPKDLRAWGSATRIARADKAIKQCGIGRAVTSNHSLKPRWVAA